MQKSRFETFTYMLNAFNISSFSAIYVYTFFIVRASAHEEFYLKSFLLKFSVNVKASLFKAFFIKIFVFNIFLIFITQLRAFLNVMSLLIRIQSV